MLWMVFWWQKRLEFVTFKKEVKEDISGSSMQIEIVLIMRRMLVSG